MSAERFDHGKRAREWVALAEKPGNMPDTTAAVAAVAQAHATLALVEQQRIANLQTERRDLRARVIGRNDERATRENARAAELDVAITEALGLS